MAEKGNALDEFEREYRAGIGQEVDMNPQRFLVEATLDNIRNFADAVGDSNPLWIDEEYAARSRFGMITAPPTFLFNINHGTMSALPIPGKPPTLRLALLYAGAELEFYRPIHLGDRFTVTGKRLDIYRKRSKSLGPMLFATGEASYYNQEKELLGVIRTTITHYKPPRGHAVRFKRKPRPEVEVKSPDLLAFERQRRGAEPRYWEDVEIGMEMTPVLEKGLLTMTEIFRFGILVSSVPRRIEQPRQSVEIGFGREAQQKRAGLENASDYGPQRVCWLGQFVTDWMGDDGTLKKYSCQVRHPSIMGDINFVKGRVKDKRIENGEHLVDCEIWVENQAGLVTAPGLATVALPSKGKER
jgi:acyl dehydratase